ncbi:MAG: TIGR02206 family membrane protein [Proteobacteria bacterium]|nr:TIGR02206 family membrane protein [Pseudomonadota bacterium]
MNIFDPDFAGKFELFTTSHIVTMLLIAVSWVVIPIVFKSKKDEKADLVFRYTLATLLVGQYLGWIIWELITNRFSLQLSLPLNLCDMSNFLCAFLLVNRSYRLYEILYFWALAGTIQSFVTPNIYFGFPHLEFIAFYIQHGGEILTILYLTIVTGLRPKAISTVKAFGFLMAFVLLVYLFNWLTGSNYMFLMADTPHPSTVTKMIKVFGEPPRHTIGLGLVSVVSILTLYVPFAIKDLVVKLRGKPTQR